jgi:flagellin-like protein
MSLLNDKRAVSPLLATVVLIAVAVAGGMVVYNLFLTTASTTGKFASINIQTIDLVKTPNTALFSIQVKNNGNIQINQIRVHLWAEGNYHYWWNIGYADPGQTKRANKKWRVAC